MTGAERRALSRKRAAAGQVVVTVVVDRADLVALLESAELFDPMREESKAALAAALEQLIELLHAARDYMAAHDVQ